MAERLDLSRSRFLVTGGAGFIGSNFVHHLRRTYPKAGITVLDKLTYAGNIANLEEVKDHPGFRFVKGDICDLKVVAEAMEGCDFVVNFAAETHVDRSIEDTGPFLRTNVGGTQCLLEHSRKSGVAKFIQISTDEVYGSLGPEGAFREDTPLDPSSPYSASKASADLWVLSYFKTYGFPGLITRCSNNYGPFHFPEKLIPLVILNAIEEKPLPIYGTGANVRDWLHVDDHARALELVMTRGRPGESYNIGARAERCGDDHRRVERDDRPPQAAQPQPVATYAAPPAPKFEEADEKPIDPNGRFATTYRPGGGYLAAFESAVARGVIQDRVSPRHEARVGLH